MCTPRFAHVERAHAFPPPSPLWLPYPPPTASCNRQRGDANHPRRHKRPRIPVNHALGRPPFASVISPRTHTDGTANDRQGADELQNGVEEVEDSDAVIPGLDIAKRADRPFFAIPVACDDWKTVGWEGEGEGEGEGR